MKTRLVKIINPKEGSIRFYKLPEERERRVGGFGVGHVRDFSQPLVI